jgi:plastocyanin
MHLSVHRSLVTLALLGAPLGLASCGSSTGPGNQTVVQVKDNFFSPSSVTVSVGQTVQWQWAGSNAHNVTWVVSSGAANSATQASGTYSRTFDTAGTYDYYCSIHGQNVMSGTVVVQ